MDSLVVAERLRAIIVEFDVVRRSIMADAPRRTTYLQTLKAKAQAENLLAQIEQDVQDFKAAAE